MADKVSPPNKPVGKGDGIKMDSHETITTPNPTFGRYFGSNKPGVSVTEPESLMGKK